MCEICYRLTLGPKNHLPCRELYEFGQLQGRMSQATYINQVGVARDETPVGMHHDLLDHETTLRNQHARLCTLIQDTPNRGCRNDCRGEGQFLPLG